MCQKMFLNLKLEKLLMSTNETEKQLADMSSTEIEALIEAKTKAHKTEMVTLRALAKALKAQGK